MAMVFCHRNGKPRRSIRTAWERACAAAGIEDLHVRGLRATCATRLQEGGATEFDVKLALGHSVGSMGVTGRYIDPHEDHRRRIAELTVRRKSDKVVPLRERNLAKNGTDLVREANVQIGDLVTS
jgi:integrase